MVHPERCFVIYNELTLKKICNYSICYFYQKLLGSLSKVSGLCAAFGVFFGKDLECPFDQ